MQGKGKSFLRGRLRWRIRILLTCLPVLTCRGVRSEHQLVKAEAELPLGIIACLVFRRFFFGKSFQKSGFFRQRDRFLGQFVPRKNS